MTAQEILNKIKAKEIALKEDLLKTKEVEAIQKELMEYLDEEIAIDSLAGLRYRKIKDGKKINSWWSNKEGYPFEKDIWDHKFKPLIEILEQYIAEKTIKKRLETEGLFIESRKQGENGDEHLIIGEKDGDGQKAHIIIDNKTGEIRVEENRKEPTEITRRVETIITLENGKKVISTREALKLTEEIGEKLGPITIDPDFEDTPTGAEVAYPRDTKLHKCSHCGFGFYVKNGYNELTYAVVFPRAVTCPKCQNTDPI